MGRSYREFTQHFPQPGWVEHDAAEIWDTTRTVLADSLIRVGSLRDTARLSFTLDVEPGEYSLSLKYLVDSLARNQRGLKGSDP